MDNLEALIAQRNALHAASEKILTDADGREGGLTAEDTTAIAANSAQFKQLSTQIEALEAHRSQTASLKVDLGRRTQPEQPGAGAAAKVTDIRDRVLDDPQRGFATPREYILAVMDAGMGRPEDKRLAPIRATAGSDEQSTFADPFGGFLVPSGFTPAPKLLTAEGDMLASRTTPIPMATPKVSFNARVDKDHSTSVSGGLRVYRRAEADTVTASRMQFEQVELNAHGLMGLSYVTEELLTDSPVSFAALLAAGFQDEFGAKLMDERINGTGIGEYLGILNSGCLVEITKETGQAADTILYENIVKMRARCWGYGSSIWLANQDTLPTLMAMSLAIGTGGSIVWQPSAREDHPDMLLGRPLLFTEFTKTVGDLGDLILGNWSQYLEGTYQPLQSDESVHVRFIYNERTFKFTIRNDGAPWWRSAMTPKNSTATLSPFVVLKARA